MKNGRKIILLIWRRVYLESGEGNAESERSDSGTDEECVFIQGRHSPFPVFIQESRNDMHNPSGAAQKVVGRLNRTAERDQIPGGTWSGGLVAECSWL